jgi:glyoxylase-like metal-dependent hydrolase (beta-lactamase superfamily II)
MEEVKELIKFETWNAPLDRPANSYLVITSKYSLLIDGGSSPIPDLKSYDIDYVLLTHWHWDHVLGLVRSDLDAVICASSRTINYISKELPTYEGFQALKNAFGAVPTEFEAVAQKSLGNTVTVLEHFSKRRDQLVDIKSCDPARLGYVSVVECPGHSDDHVCYIVGEHAFVGDSINPGEGLTLLSVPDYMSSMLKLFAIDNWHVAHPGHGPEVTRERAAQWLSELFRSKIEKMAKLASSLDGQWRPLKDYLDVLYPEASPVIRWIGARSLLGYAISLQQLGVAELKTDGSPWLIRAKKGSEP